jgi:hypothetical protein
MSSGTERALSIAPGLGRDNFRSYLVRLAEGRLWPSPDRNARVAAEVGARPEWWLTAGEAIAIAPGTSVVAEAWPWGRFELREAAPV